jgi:hypothetical protein
VYIVTTSKRIHQITALVFICLALTAAIAIFRYYDQYTAQPSDVFNHLFGVIEKSNSLDKNSYDRALLFAEAKHTIFMQIQSDLGRVNPPDPAGSAKFLIDQASSFLTDDAMLHKWLEVQLHSMTNLTTDVDVISSSLTKQSIVNGDQCLAIEKQSEGWRLVSFLNCQ